MEESKKEQSTERIRKSRKDIGKIYEEQCREYLKSKGIKVLEWNFRCRFGEIDIIGKDADYLIFFEVKARRTDNSGYAQEAVTYRKQRTICRVCDVYLAKHGISLEQPVRFDVLAVNQNEIVWYQNAFDYCK